jgi:hypothetical protein
VVAVDERTLLHMGSTALSSTGQIERECGRVVPAPEVANVAYGDLLATWR